MLVVDVGSLVSRKKSQLKHNIVKKANNKKGTQGAKNGGKDVKIVLFPILLSLVNGVSRPRFLVVLELTPELLFIHVVLWWIEGIPWK